MQGYPDEGGATEAPDAGASSGDFPAAINTHFSPVGQHSGSADGAAATSREGRDARADGVYGALDLGTNNCRLLVARPSRRGFRVVDAFSRIIRLGEGVSQTGRLSEAAMARTLEALKVCAAKLGRAKVRRSRLVATEACRVAENGAEFLARVRDKLGLDIEILTPEAEARLAVSGWAALIDASCDFVLVFDIGGGSSELIWLDLDAPQPPARPPLRRPARRAALHRRLDLAAHRRRDAGRALRRPPRDAGRLRGDGRARRSSVLQPFEARAQSAPSASPAAACTCSAPPAP